jgi:hypothetical protein
MDWAGSRDGEPGGWPSGPPLGEAELRGREFRERTARLMGDYRASCETGWDGYGYPDDDQLSYPSYGSSAEAAGAVTRYRAEADRAGAAVMDAEAREPAVRQRLDQARGALERTWPWQRARRAGLRSLISDAEEDLWVLDWQADSYSCSATRSEQLCADAGSAAAVLRRREHAQAAAGGAVARTLGWQPGDPPPARQRWFRAGPDGIEDLPAGAGATCREAAGVADVPQPGPGRVPAAGQLLVPPSPDVQPGGSGPWL